MASIRENKKDGKTVSYRFIVCIGRDNQNKQIRKYMTWIPPEGLTPAKARKAAERAADLWEQEVREEFRVRIEAETTKKFSAGSKIDFVSFVNDVWMPLKVIGDNKKPKTVSFYQSMTKILNGYFKGQLLQEITAMDIQKYLNHLRTEYIGKYGQPLTPKTVHHQYNTLNLIFGYAEEQELISKNPMKKVDAPKKIKKPVDAMSTEEARRFFDLMPMLPLDFRCMLLLFITTGLRRGECVGLKWNDIDENSSTLHIERSGSFISGVGTIISTPKTVNSIRTVPLMPYCLRLLQQLKHQTQIEYPDTILNEAYIFHSSDNIFMPRNPDAITRRIKRFMSKNGFADLSAHDLRHSCASLLLAQGADIKSVQEILGHSDASTTLNFYVRADIKQMKNATEKLAKAYGL